MEKLSKFKNYPSHLATLPQNRPRKDELTKIQNLNANSGKNKFSVGISKYPINIIVGILLYETSRELNYISDPFKEPPNFFSEDWTYFYFLFHKNKIFRSFEN